MLLVKQRNKYKIMEYIITQPRKYINNNNNNNL